MVKKTELELINEKIAALEEKLKVLRQPKLVKTDLDLAKEKAASLEAQIEDIASQTRTVTLISEAKARIFDVDPVHVVRIVRGAQEQMLLNDKIVRILPGSIVEFTEKFAKFLLTYKEFKVYGA